MKRRPRSYTEQKGRSYEPAPRIGRFRARLLASGTDAVLASFPRPAQPRNLASARDVLGRRWVTGNTAANSTILPRSRETKEGSARMIFSGAASLVILPMSVARSGA